MAKLLPMQRADFVELFEIMKGLPVTIRLLDPPLHEFLPPLAEATDERMRSRIRLLTESNPMLGTRGCRLGIQWPEIYEMQVRAIARAARVVQERTGDVPARTAQSDALSQDLLKRGFKFVGSTICYAYMQAVGLVDDHLDNCFRRQKW